MTETNAGGKYQERKSRIRAELEAYEGEGPPSARQLWNVAAYNGRSVAGWISDMPVDEDNIQTARGDVLEALVALEMAEERLLDTESER